VFPELIETQQSPALLQRLCMVAQQFTSSVSIEMPNALLLDIKGSVKLFGSLGRLHAGIDAAWGGLALRAHSATAPSTLAALWFARAATPALIEDPGMLTGRLAGLPIACTCWDAERLQTLRNMGVTRMGELLRLPRAGVARRLGPTAVVELDIALARQPAPRRAFVPRERFRECCDFETEIENVDHLEKALEPLIERCAQFLRRRQAGIQMLRLKLRHRSGSATCVHAGLASITGEHRRLREVLTQKLRRLELAAPVRGMELISGSLRMLSASSLDAFAGPRAGTGIGAGCGRDSVPQLVERLRSRLGEEAVYGVASIPEHRPEAAWRRVPELRFASSSGAGAQEPSHGGRTAHHGTAEHEMPRPLWLLDAPAPLPAQAASLPLRDLILEEGPERIESGWWDGKGIERDYYVARKIHGERLWVFQERRSKRWFVHGVFA
jgi:protein ImuB